MKPEKQSLSELVKGEARDVLDTSFTPPSSNKTAPNQDAVIPIPTELLEWMSGVRPAPPARLANMMGDISNKLSYFTMLHLVNRMGSLGRLVDRMRQVEIMLFSPQESANLDENIRNMSRAELKSEHSILSKTINEAMEFGRKMATQSKDLITDPERDELVDLIRSLDVDGLKAIKGSLASIIKSRTGKGIDPKQEKGLDDDNLHE